MIIIGGDGASGGGVVLVPVVCLVEAARRVDLRMLEVLVDNPVCELAPLTGEPLRYHW